jgi:hypothetical protein
VEMMAELVFRPIKDRIGDGTYLLYDDACGTGGMLTVGEAKLARKEGKKTEIHLYGQELNPDRDLRHLQGRPAAQGRGRGGPQYRLRLDLVRRCARPERA